MTDLDCDGVQARQPATHGEVEGSNPSGTGSAEEEIARLSALLGITLSRDQQLTGQTVGDRREATTALCNLVDEVKALRRALGPFAEIARRLGWDKYDPDSMELRQHVLEAPAPEIEVAYCLTVGAFWRAAHLLDGDANFDHPSGSTFAPSKSKPWWRR